MKLLTMLFICLSINLTHAGHESGAFKKATAEWNQQEGILELIGPTARDLYRSLKARPVQDKSYSEHPLALKNVTRIVKRNSFAKCSILSEKIVIGRDVVSRKIISADCEVFAPRSKVY